MSTSNKYWINFMKRTLTGLGKLRTIDGALRRYRS